MPKELFKTISHGKRRRIMQVAAKEFARYGYHETNVNRLAEKAGISKGAIYVYFSNKEDLFISTVQYWFKDFARVAEEILMEESDSFTKLENYLVRMIEFGIKNPALVINYLNLYSAGMAKFSRAMSSQIERIGASYLFGILEQGVKKGEVRRDVDLNITSFILDNELVMFWAATLTPYYRIRFGEFMKVPQEKVDHRLIIQKVREMVALFKNILSPQIVSRR